MCGILSVVACKSLYGKHAEAFAPLSDDLRIPISVHLEDRALTLDNRGLFSRAHSLAAGLPAPLAAIL